MVGQEDQTDAAVHLETMSPPYGECVVVNPNSAIDNLNTVSPPEFRFDKNTNNVDDKRNDDSSTTIESILLKGTEIRQKIVEAIINKTENFKNLNSAPSKLKLNSASSKLKLNSTSSNNGPVDAKLMEELGKLTLERKTGDMNAQSREKMCRSPPMKNDTTIYSSTNKVKGEEKSIDGDSAFYNDEEILSDTLSGLSLNGGKILEKSSKNDSRETKETSNDKENVEIEAKTTTTEVEKSPPQAENVKKSVSSSQTSAPVKRQFIKPKDIINSSRQKSLILAHKSKTASAPQVPQDVVTQDLLGTNLKKCRDNKNVDELAKALTQLHVRKTSGAGQHQLLVEDRVQRSPIPVQVVPNRRAAAAPYRTDLTSSHNRGQGSNYSDTFTNQSQLAQICYESQPQSIEQQCYDQAPFAYNSISSSNSSYIQVRTVYQSSPPHPYDNISSPPYWISPTHQQQQQHFNDDEIVPSPPFSLSPTAATFGGQSPQFGHQLVPSSQQCSIQSSPSSFEPDAVTFTNNEISVATPRLLEQTAVATDVNGNRPAYSPIDEPRFVLPPEDELPEPLTDFILNYSWKDTKSDISEDNQAVAVCKTQSSSPTGRSSPFSSVGTPGDSPAAPQTTRILADSPSKVNSGVADTAKVATQQQHPLSSENDGRKSARQKFRESIKNDEFNRAWIWALRCSQSSPGALFYRDADGDSFLHIVVWQKDMAKIYALTELMKSNDAHQTKPFDLKNKLNETPLFLAVEKRLKDVVAYGLENCANPNIQAFNRDQDTPLHYAAARGMVVIAQLLCECPLVNVNMMNGAGLTPLLCAVKSHRNKEEESQSLIDNKSIAGTLLKYGADPKLYDAKTGKNILHYAVECMDPQMIRVFRDHMDKEILHTLVNQRCYASQTPFELLAATEFARGIDYVGTEEGQLIRLEMGRLLTELGAELPRMTAGSGTESPDFFVSYDETFFP